jgi:hypothetical protein
MRQASSTASSALPRSRSNAIAANIPRRPFSLDTITGIHIRASAGWDF